MSALDRFGDLGGLRGLLILGCVLAAGTPLVIEEEKEQLDDEEQLDEIRRLGT